MLPYYTLSSFNIGPITLHIWGVFAGLAFAAALIIALKEARRKNINEDYILDLAILVLISGVAGARAFFVAENWNYFSQNTTEIFSLNEGGLMFFGGAIGATLAIFFYLKFLNRRLSQKEQKKISLARIADTLAPSLAIGEFIGRIGCALGDLHIGAVTSLPWAQKYFDGSERHPIAIYMALNGLLMFAALWFFRLRLKTEGALFLFFVLWYSGTRFFLDFLRCGDLAECDPRYAGLTPSQYISVLAFLAVLIILFNLFKKTKNMEETKKQTPDTAEYKIKNNASTDEAVFELDDQAGETTATDSKSAKHKKRLTGIIIVIIAFSVGAGLISGFYERFFKKEIFSFRGKTWVAYDKPIINLTIINDATCKECSVADITKQLKAGLMPTMVFKEIDYNSQEGKEAIKKFSIKSLPAFVFDSGVEKLDNFSQFSQVLTNKDGQYFLNSAAVGLKAGKVLETLQVLATDRVKGPADAPVTIIEFSDFQCPFCKTASEIMKQVLAAYPGKIRFVYKEFPLTQIHQNAQSAAEAAECAGDQEKFWEMHDLLFANQDKLDAASIAKYANQLKLNKKDFDSCVSSGKFKAKIEADSKTAASFGVKGTPTFFINEQQMTAAPTVDNFKTTIDSLLKAK